MKTALWRNAHWRGVTAAFVYNGLLFGVWASRIPAFKEHFALDPKTLGLLLLAIAGGAIVSFPLAGALSERWGADRLTIRCAWLYGPALILAALAPSPVILGAALFLFGAVQGSMDVAMNAWGARVETRMSRPTMSIFHAMFSLGAGLGAASGYLAAHSDITVLLHFAAMVLVLGTLALIVMMAARMPREQLAAHDEKKPLVVIPSGTLLLLGLMAFAISMGEGAMADWSAVFLREAMKASEAQAALGYTAFSITMVLTRLSGGVLVHYLGPVRTAQASGLIAFIGLITVIFAPDLALALIGFALIGIGYATVIPLVFSRAANDPGMRPGPAIAGVATLSYGGMLLGPPLVGFVAQVAGLRLSFAMLALLALFAAAMAPNLRMPPKG
ncbi:MAG: MFS transporter [Paracoccus sp. (in: a-proteobacteria)]